MAGKYRYISENDYSREDGRVFLEGRTHGCDCCAHDEEVTAESLNAHIAKLEQEIQDCKKLYQKYFA